MESANGKLSAAEKKRARKQKAKGEKQRLKEESKQVHAELHKAQDQEAQGRASRNKKSEELVKVGNTNDEVILDYVAEPLEALQDLKAAADDAAIAANPYEGMEGVEVSADRDDKAAVIADLDRIAKLFAPDGQQSAVPEQADGSAAEAVEGTDAVVTAGTEDDAAKKAAEEAAGAYAVLRTCLQQAGSEFSALLSDGTTR